MKLQTLIRSEDAEAEVLAQYLLLLQRQGKIELYTKIPNETYTKSWSAKRKNTRLGLRPGFPDYVVVTEKFVLFPELKRTKNSVTSVFQKEWIAKLDGKITVSRVCKGYDQAKQFIDAYI
jgi:hypothetical protein